ncbi:MAG TPA: VWA domain-containing protein, partial [Pyrinomonadaceae bacterium]|nr:VWA domain-containing protein [Pyrinomonadaceae bacterium]
MTNKTSSADGKTTLFPSAATTALALLLAAALAAPPALARREQQQQPRPAAPEQQPSPPPAEADEDEVVRITTNLVQVDAVVIDKDGKQVTDLRPEDFEVSEDGRPQAITNFSYIDTEPAAARPAPPARPGEAAPAPAGPARREQVRRTIAIVVDDLGMAFQNVAPARRALRAFIDDRVQPGDLVAVIRTGGEVGALQQFTTDKRQMRAAVERVRWNPCSRRGIGGDLTDFLPLCSSGSERASLNALAFTVRGMRELPGRKSLIIFSDSLPIHERDINEIATSGLPGGGPTQPPASRNPAIDTVERSPEMRRADRNRVTDPLRELGDAAVRASVVIYAIDTRGLQWLGLTAADNTSGMTPQGISDLMSARSRDDFEGREGPALLTEQTGGFLVRNSNDIPRALGRIMEDLRGYYLLGYRPRGETFDRRFHRISVRVKNRPGLSVRSRRGFYGLPEEERPAPRTAADRFQLALISPFSAGDIGLQLTPVFAVLPEGGPFLRAMLHIDPEGLTFTPEANGWEKSDLVLRGILFGENGSVAEEHRHAFTLRMRGETLRRIRAHGL